MIISEIVERRSVRKYKATPVTDEQVNELLQAANLAPSGNNAQSWRFIVIRGDENRAKIVAADHNQQWMLQAPVFIACIGDMKSRTDADIRVDEYCGDYDLKRVIRDCSNAIENLMLQAVHMGLGTCWTGWYAQDEMRRALNVPDDKYVCGVITVGYADESPKARPRADLKEIVHYEQW